MKQRGRKSSLAVVATDIRGVTRLGPPASLIHGAERAVWLRTVNSRPAEWFGPEHEPLLANYCRHVVGADVIAAQLDRVDPTSLEGDEGLARYERLRRLLLAETRAVQRLAHSMRLAQVTLYRAEASATSVEQEPRRLPWASE
jgi:hypothetical protein